MKISATNAALFAAALAHLSKAMVTPPTDGSILACKGQGCNTCLRSASVNGAGYPACYVYNSADYLGQDFAANMGNGYTVWWDSGTPNPGCKIIVRTPAGQDLPACGYQTQAWSDAGCYYTELQNTFMLQYCCGSGDCEAAGPAASIADAHYQMAQGNTTKVSLVMDTLNGTSGKRSIEGVGEMVWERSGRKEAVQQRDESVGNSCYFTPSSGKTTVGGRQRKVSTTNVCNTAGGCTISTSFTLTEGETVSPQLQANLFSVISAGVGYTFTEQKSYAVSTTYTQTAGTTGYLTFVPTNNCWEGTFHNCVDRRGDDIVAIDPNRMFTACTPNLLTGGQLDGSNIFVYTQ